MRHVGNKKTLVTLNHRCLTIPYQRVTVVLSDDVFSSLSSVIVVHLPAALWTHVWTPLLAHQTLHPQQGWLILLYCCFFWFTDISNLLNM